MPLSEYDLQAFGDIVAGHGDWFTAELIRLVAKADESNRSRLRLAFPVEVRAYEAWFHGDGRVNIREYVSLEEE